MFKGKKLKKNEKPKTFVSGEQFDKSTLQQTNQINFGQDQIQQRAERIQPTKEDIEIIRVN